MKKVDLVEIKNNKNNKHEWEYIKMVMFSRCLEKMSSPEMRKAGLCNKTSINYFGNCVIQSQYALNDIMIDHQR